MEYFKMLAYLGATGISFIFELKVIFVDIFEIGNLNIKKINEATNIY